MGVWKRKKFLVAGALAAVLVAFGGMLIPSGDTYADDDDAFTTCASSGAAESLGWIICPIMDMMGNASEGLYNGAVKPALQVEPKLFTRGGEDGTRGGWETFRNIANGLLIALFLVVIFSQLTGVGIDNYGIKKILPKIIVAAILMNLSYWICVAFVDVSNILGNSIQSLFDGLADNFNFRVDTLEDGSGGTADIGGAIASGGATLLSVAIIGAIVAGGGYAILSNPAILLGVLIGAIGVIVSIFFLFILLSVREAAIVVLVVLSPLAIACYMLPNTKNIFDKWLKLFEALLMVYPICGLLVGGGNYVSTLLLKVSVSSHTVNIFPTITAMVVGIVPIFFFPTVLKNAFAGLGNLGAKITGMGDRVGSRLQGATQNSRAYKYAQERGRERQTRWNAGLTKDGTPVQYGTKGSNARRWVSRNVRGRFGQLMRISNDNTARNRSQYAKDMANDKEVERLMTDEGMAATLAGVSDAARRQESKDRTTMLEKEYEGQGMDQMMIAWNEAFDEGDSGRLDALTNVLTSKYGTGAANAIGKALADKHGIADNENYQSSMQTLQRTMADNSNFAGNMRSKAADAFQMIQDAGMRYDEGTNSMVHADLSHFSANNAIATDIKDWSTQSGATLERAYKSGNLTSEMATQILNSTDPSIQSGIQSDPSKREALEAAAYNQNTTGVGPFLPNEVAAQRYRDEQDAAAAAEQQAQLSAEQIQQAQRDQMAQSVQNIEGALVGGGTPQAAGAAVGSHAAAGGAGDNSGELTIQHDDGGAGAGAASGAGAAATSAAAASAVHSRATAAQTSTTPAQSRLEIAHSMNDARLREAQRNVDAQNQGNRQWPGNPQTPRGI